MENNRTEASIKNINYSLFSQLMILIVNFISRTIFIKSLGSDYLGLNGLFSNILAILSIADLGLGNAITFYLYKPLRNKDKFRINQLMSLYARAYNKIGCFILLAGFLITPFISFFINNEESIPHVKLFFILYLLSMVVTYFFSYYKSLIIADQKKYIEVSNKNLFFILMNIFQIISLIKYKNYFLYLILQIIFNFLENLRIYFKIKKMYPYLKINKIIKHEINDYKDITQNIKAMMLHRIGGVVVNGTDNILISSFIGTYWVGMYANYNMIISSLNNILSQILNSLTASIGNFNAEDDSNKSYDLFEKIQFINFCFYAVCTIGLCLLLDGFINLWLGEEYILNQFTVFILVLNFYMKGMRTTVLMFRDTKGLYLHDRYKSVVEATINLVASLLLVDKMGMDGVFIGTFISTLLVSFWIEPLILYRYGFKMPVNKYFKKYLLQVGTLLFMYISCLIFVRYIPCSNLLEFILSGSACVIISVLCIYFTWFKSKELKYLISIINKFKIFKKFAAIRT